ncbi:MAG TPA: contact-dependent growth inhibition system immunity protein [Trinickia sp.]|nr:contact-dependent growth inhibition system immunity protein [Trinickia sp.]
MEENPLYPELNQLFGVYLNQDCRYWGKTIAEIINCYKRDSSAENIKAMLDEIKKFKHEYTDNLDEAFKEAYGFDFNPELWGYTTSSFFDELKRLVQE